MAQSSWPEELAGGFFAGQGESDREYDRQMIEALEEEMLDDLGDKPKSKKARSPAGASKDAIVRHSVVKACGLGFCTSRAARFPFRR